MAETKAVDDVSATPLWLDDLGNAVLKNDVCKVHKLLDSGILPLPRSPDQVTAVMLAARNGCNDIMELFLHYGVIESHHCDNLGFNLLHYMFTGTLKNTVLLRLVIYLEDHGLHIQEKETVHKTFQFNKLVYSRPQFQRQVGSKELFQACKQSPVEDDCTSAFHYAVLEEDLELIDAILSHIYGTFTTSQLPSMGNARHIGQTYITKFDDYLEMVCSQLINSGNIVVQPNSSAVEAVCGLHLPGILVALIVTGKAGNLSTALHQTATMQNRLCLKILIHYGADCNNIDDIFERTPLASLCHTLPTSTHQFVAHGSSQLESIGCLEQLLANTDDLYRPDSEGYTILHTISKTGNFNYFRLLKQYADLTKFTETKQADHTILGYSVECSDILLLLIKAGFSVSDTGNMNETPLYRSLISPWGIDSANILVDHGASVEVICNENHLLPLPIYNYPEHFSKPIVSHMLKCRVNVNGKCSVNSQSRITGLFAAVMKYHMTEMYALLDVNCDLDIICTLNGKEYNILSYLLPLFHEDMEDMFSVLMKCVSNPGRMLNTTDQHLNERLHRCYMRRTTINEHICHNLHNVRTLKHLAMLIIRKSIGTYPHNRMEDIPLPASLKDYILLKDIIKYNLSL